VNRTSMRSRPSASELLAWTLLGAAAGVVAGFVLGEWIGPLTPSRAGRALARAKGARESGPRLKTSETARAARRALKADAQLSALELEPIAVGPGVVQLHGWVPNRGLRTRATRIVAAVPGIDSLVNCLLVHGEDDAAATRDVTDQPA
jgi:BON domain